jgi:hypothetical protein
MPRAFRETVRLAINRAAIRVVVESHRALNPRIRFLVRGQDTDDSDLDILIDPTPKPPVRYQARLELPLLGVKVDVLTPNTLGRVRAGLGRGARYEPRSQRLPDYLAHIGQASDIQRYTNGSTGCVLGEQIVRTRDQELRGRGEPAAISSEGIRTLLRHPELPLTITYEMRNALAHGYFKWTCRLSGRRSQRSAAVGPARADRATVSNEPTNERAAELRPGPLKPERRRLPFSAPTHPKTMTDLRTDATTRRRLRRHSLSPVGSLARCWRRSPARAQLCALSFDPRQPGASPGQRTR